jgi:serine/threonine-protein kinase
VVVALDRANGITTFRRAQMLGERFGGFKAFAKLGAGTVGEVYLAAHQRIERRAAIKVLTPERSRDAEAVRRLFIEARATSLIRHPGIVEIYDCDVHRNGRAYIVMEYLEGETIGRRLEKGAMPWTTACLIARRVAEAIAAAHARAIIHRDLKPDNVFLTSASDRPAPAEVKVLDFGFAKLLNGNLVGGLPTQAGSLLGSPAYMSPEQCEGRAADHRADIYSLGCVLFEMVTSRPLFPLDNVRHLLAAHISQTPPSLSAIAPHVPAWVGFLVGRMVAKAPADRPQSMAKVAEILAGAEAPSRPDDGRGIVLALA